METKNIANNKMALMAALHFLDTGCHRSLSGDLDLNRSDKALRTPASSALIDVMHEARLVRLGFGAGKAHLRAAFYAHRVNVETPCIAPWHARTPLIGVRWQPASYGSTIVAASNLNLLCTGWTPFIGRSPHCTTTSYAYAARSSLSSPRATILNASSGRRRS